MHMFACLGNRSRQNDSWLHVVIQFNGSFPTDLLSAHMITSAINYVINCTKLVFLFVVHFCRSFKIKA